MLRRRIFSSAMASVMALSSVAVVANAEETAVANYKTKADLEAYVKSFDGFREDGLYDYGSISGENFLNAIEYAENVIADDGDNDQCTVAYDMLVATYNALKIYSAEELKVLLDSCKATYERGNIYNEELNDEIYTADSFANFENAYLDAESVLDSNDSRVITDAYETLEAAKSGLSANTVVTKAQFRAALKDYETMLSKEYAYESWRRGAFTGNWITLAGNGDWWKYSGTQITYGAAYNMLATLADAIYTQYDEMDKIKTLNKTSDKNIVDQYKLCVDAPVILNNWIADDTARATKANVTKILKEYHGLLAYDYVQEDVEGLYSDIVDAINDVTEEYNKTDDGKKNPKNYLDSLTVEQLLASGLATEMKAAKKVANPWVVTTTKFTTVGYKTDDGSLDHLKNIVKETSASLTIKYTEDVISIPVDDETGYYDATKGYAPIIGSASTDQVNKAKADGLTYKKISKKTNCDLTQFIEVSAADVYDWTLKTAAADATTAGDVIADVNASVEEATVTATDAAKAINTLLTAEEATTIDITVGDTKVPLVPTEKQAAADLEAAAIAPAAKAVAKKYLDGAYAALAEALKILEELGIKLSGADATKEDVKAATDAAEKKAELLEDVVTVLAPYAQDKNNDNFAKLVQAELADGETLEGALKDSAWNLSGFVTAVMNVAEDAKTTIDGGVEAGDEFVAEEVKKENAKNRAALTDTTNADKNKVIDGGYAQGHWNEHNDNWGISVSYNAADFYRVDLDLAMDIAQYYINNTARDAFTNYSNIYYLSTNDGIVDGTANGSSAEWTLVYRYLKYALEDKYGVSDATHTKADVVALIDEAYELAELTGDAALFAGNHNILVDTRKAAVEWVKEANKDKKYKDNTITYAYTYRKNPTSWEVANEVYKYLKDAYDALKKDYDAFKYSFKEIHDQIAVAEDMIDAGDLEATDALVKALNDTAYALSVIKPLTYADGTIEFNDNDAFTSDRYFQGFNRLFTNGGEYDSLLLVDETTKIKISKGKGDDGNPAGPNASHESLKVAYEALLAEIKAQTEVTVIKGDVNGDGVVNAFDASALLKNIVNTVAMDAAVADYDASGIVNALDASAILKAIVTA